MQARDWNEGLEQPPWQRLCQAVQRFPEPLLPGLLVPRPDGTSNVGPQYLTFYSGRSYPRNLGGCFQPVLISLEEPVRKAREYIPQIVKQLPSPRSKPRQPFVLSTFLAPTDAASPKYPSDEDGRASVI